MNASGKSILASCVGLDRQTLREDGEFVLYRSSQAAGPDAQPLLMLAAVGEQVVPGGLARLQHEYSVRSLLEPAWAARPLELDENSRPPVLMLQDPGGELLERLVGEPMEIATFLRLAIGLCAALSGAHRRGLIHKDVKPANVLADTATGRAWLLGFGICSRLARERALPDPLERIAGTLAYMSPEQTGRMNRSVDSRSDLYSMGVTLYQMLTGVAPFNASDPMEWAHCHIARMPIPPGERGANLPQPISQIIMKLLAKTAEERYQTAAGVQSDLERCLEEWKDRRHIAAFELAARDAPDRLLIPEKLYGRSKEVKDLVGSFDRIAHGGAPEMVLVGGYSGIGKSSVVQELHKVLVLPRGLFASGKFDQYKRDIPYSTLVQAFRGLVRFLLCKSEMQLAGWREAIGRALGPNGQLMLDLVPDLRLIIGEQPPVPQLPTQQAQSRFQLVLRRFIAVFARPEHPLALFLDDLQWLDSATLDLIEDLLTRSDVTYLLLVGAYRDNEVDSTHPLARKLEMIRKAGGIVHDISLEPLTCDDVGQLVADALRCSPQRARPLAELVHEKTAGNPFFAIQFLSALVEEGLLTFDWATNWSWDLRRIRDKRHTDNVVELMIGKLTRLPVRTQRSLQQLACLGNGAEAALLQMIYEEADLQEAVRTGLVLRTEHAYAFVHDRVQEAAYSLIPEPARAATHLRIGRLLASRTAPGEIEDKIFEIVNQLNRASHLIVSAEECERVARLNLIAGQRAKMSTAYASASVHLEVARQLLGEESWQRDYALVFAVQFHLAECELLTANATAAEDRLSMLAARARGVADVAAVARLRLTLYTTLDRSDRGVQVCLDYLQERGTQWSPQPTREQVHLEYGRIAALIGNRSIEELVELPLMTDVDSQATLDVLTEAVTPALFTNENLLSLVICRMVNLSLQYGNSGGSCFAYVWLGMIAGPHFGDYAAGFRFGRLGYELVDRPGLERFQARTYMSFGNLVIPWTKHIRGGRELVRRAFEAANRIGDLTFAAYSCNNLVTNLLACGEPLADVQREAECGLDFARRARFGLVCDIIAAQLALIRCLRGLTPSFGTFDDEHFEEDRFERHLRADSVLALPECWYWIRKLQARMLAGDYPRALEAAGHAGRLLWTSPSFFEVADYHFYAALTRAACCADDFGEHFAALTEHHRQLLVWASNCPENFECRAALIGAEIARLESREAEAERLYERAIDSAGVNGFVQVQAMAYELAGRFYAERRGFAGTAGLYLRRARDSYVRWGADGKVRHLERLHPHLTAEMAVPRVPGSVGAPLEHLDLATVIKVSQAVAGEIVLDKLLDTLMRAAIEHAGAERGLLLIEHEGALQLEAEATTTCQSIAVRRRQESSSAGQWPQSILHYVVRTHESVILDDASADQGFADDAYIRARSVRSLLCVPLIKRTTLVGVLYLENNLATCVFTPGRSAVLNLLASQAAISLENAYLYSRLEQENSERCRVESALRLSEAYLAEAQKLSHTGSFGWNPTSGDVYWSAESFRIFELDGTGAPGLERILQTVHPQDRHLVASALERARYEKREFKLEHRLLMRDGSVKHLRIDSRVWMNDFGEPEFVGTVMDITERKREEEARLAREREREEMQLRLQQAAKLEAVGRLAGGIAHDFNNLLGAILGYGELVQDALAEGSAVRRHVDKVMQAGFRGRALVERILAFSRSSVSERASLNVQPIVLEVLDMLVPSLPSGIGLHRRLDAADAAVVADAVQLHEVVMNLCTNAVHAMERGGTLTVALELLAVSHQRYLSHGTLSAGQYVRLQITDTGTGIAPEVMERLFEPFFTTKRLGEGTGLGLALVHGIVGDFGGAIDVTTQVGAGSTFTIWLPESAVRPEPAEGQSGEMPRGRGQTVMVVDDERALRTLAEETLAELGYEPRGFDCGIAALQAFREQPGRFDLVLTDEKMPGMTGTALARAIRQIRAEIPIVLMSGYCGTQLAESARAAGVREVIHKPLVRREIAEPLARALRGQVR